MNDSQVAKSHLKTEFCTVHMYMGPSLIYYFQWIYLLGWITIILLKGNIFFHLLSKLCRININSLEDKCLIDHVTTVTVSFYSLCCKNKVSTSIRECLLAALAQ